MTTAVVIQPSFLPWRGYFDMIRRSDVFAFYDDVQYDKHGWRNRNRIKTAQGLRWLTVPVRSKGNTVAHTPINEVEIDWTRDWRRTHLEQLRHAYGKAPHYDRYAGEIQSLYAQASSSLAEFTIRSTEAIAGWLGIETQFVRSSQYELNGSKTDRLLDLLQQIGATHYISGPSARAYIEPEKFQRAGITLEYMTYDYEPYEQLHPPYEAHVSIVDSLFMRGAQL
ncbi:MAG TPA: WbqC family protein [Candidatus Baltobacteraceae bacterium]|nr:WbqC family protein [Candidatus Baltobacteraceae bacterium]